MTITEFLLARIAEDEADARTMQQWIDDMNANPPLIHEQEDPPDVAFADPARVLAECKAKRRIIDSAESFGTWEGSLGEDVLLALASIYADHPDYREEWRV